MPPLESICHKSHSSYISVCIEFQAATKFQQLHGMGIRIVDPRTATTSASYLASLLAPSNEPKYDGNPSVIICI
jgi:hypothetical protein